MADVVQAGAAAVTAVVDVGNALRQVTKVLDDSLDLDSIHGHMDREMKMLLALKEDHRQKVRRHATKMSSRTHIEWDNSVGQIEAQVKELTRRYKCEFESERRPLLDVVSRSELSEEMRKKVSDISDLLGKGNQFEDSLLVDKEAERVVKIVGAPEIQGFPTLQKPLQNILDLLENNKVKGIEVYGFVGYGKTAIMQNLNNHEKVKEMFDKVIWVKVSTEDKKKNSSIEHLQKVIIQRLKLVMDDVDDVGEVAKIIREELERIKYLILLDDVKDDLDLNQVGIPHTKVGSKIVLATTIPNKLFLCRSFVDRRIEVKKLSKKETWEMFQTILDRPDLAQQIKKVKPRVVKLGDGVPLMIKMVARCCRMNNTEGEWDDRLKNLTHWPSKGDVVMKELYDVLNFCYGNLNDVQKDCFLFSALYPEDGEIYCGGLLDGWWGENLLGGSNDVHSKARLTLQDLKWMLFLKEGMNNQYVRMDKWIRRAALLIMETADHLIRTSEALKEPPNEQHWRQKKWISLVDNHLRTLPDKPDCSVLSTLFLQENSDLIKIPDPFFECMKNLRVLGLYDTGIESLPSSLSNLISLKVLNLYGCAKLVEFPSQIVELQNLEVLDIRGSGLSNIPPQIRLRRLLASFTCSINATNIPQISTLKELIFDVRFSKNEWDGMLNDVLKNLSTLKKLTNLQFCFEDEHIDVIKKMADGTFKIFAPKADHLNSFVYFVEGRDESESTSIQIYVGCSITADLQLQGKGKIDEFQMYVKYCHGKNNNVPIVELFPKADALEIVDHSGLEHLSCFGTQKLSRIRGCLIQRCPRIRTIMDGNCTLHTSILSKLELLYLDNLPKLQSIWDGALQLGSLPNLITLNLASCPELIEIFPQKKIEEVIQNSHNSGQKLCVFPKLKKIVLIDMQNLTSVYENDSLEWPSLVTLRISNCPKLTGLRFTEENAKKLKMTVDI